MFEFLRRWKLKKFLDSLDSESFNKVEKELKIFFKDSTIRSLVIYGNSGGRLIQTVKFVNPIPIQNADIIRTTLVTDDEGIIMEGDFIGEITKAGELKIWGNDQ